MAGILAVASNNPALAQPYASPFAAFGISAGFSITGPGLDLTLSTPQRPIWLIHGDQDSSVPYSSGQTFADQLESVNWPYTFTTVEGAGHAWLWQSKFGHDNEELWRYFMEHPLP